MYVTPSAPIRPVSLQQFANSTANKEADCTADSHEGHEHEPKRSPHMNDITSVSIPLPVLESEQELRSGRFYQVMRDLIWEGTLPAGSSSASTDDTTSSAVREGEFDILRTKGFFRVAGSPQRCFVLQGVRNAFEITEVPADLGDDEAGSIKPKLVLIAKGLGDGEAVKKRFLAAVDRA